jgi:hypothetical protein
MIRPLRVVTYICVLWLGLLGGCTGSIGSASSNGGPFYTATSSILPGEDIGLRLVNQTDLSLRYNLCRSTVQRRSGGEWASAGLNRTCPDVRFRLAPTETAAFDLPTPRNLPPGTYRVLTPVSYEDREMQTLRTGEFQVTSDPSRSDGPTSSLRSSSTGR